MILLNLIEKSSGTSFKFHSRNLLFKSNKTKLFPAFYREIILNWKKHIAMMAEIPSCILPQYLWHNKSIQVDKASVHFLTFSEKSINYVSQLFSDNGSIKRWHEFKREYNLNESSYFKWWLQWWQTARNYAETVPFHKISTPGNLVKLRYFTQCQEL